MAGVLANLFGTRSLEGDAAQSSESDDRGLGLDSSTSNDLESPLERLFKAVSEEQSPENSNGVETADALATTLHEEAPRSKTEILGVGEVSIEALHPNRLQPRRKVEDDAIEDLARSIAAKGILQPILVRSHPEILGEFEIVAGELRWLAAELAQLETVPVVIRELTDTEALECALIENLQRQDLRPLELAEAYSSLIEQCNHTQESLAAAIGKSRSHVSNTLRLLNLPSSVRELLEGGELTAGHARALLSAGRPEELAREVVARTLTVRDTEDLVRNAPTDSAPAKKIGKSPLKGADIDPLLTAMFGQKVTIKRRGKSGTLSIHFDSEVQLDRTVEQLKSFYLGMDESVPAKGTGPKTESASNEKLKAAL